MVWSQDGGVVILVFEQIGIKGQVDDCLCHWFNTGMQVRVSSRLILSIGESLV